MNSQSMFEGSCFRWGQPPAARSHLALHAVRFEVALNETLKIEAILNSGKEFAASETIIYSDKGLLRTFVQQIASKEIQAHRWFGFSNCKWQVIGETQIDLGTN